MSSRFTARYPRLLLAVVVVLAITACQKKPEPAGEAPAAATTASDALEGQVDIVAWPGYIERGDTDRNYDWVTPFEQETSCKVNVKTAGTSDEMVSLMTQGGYDLVTASGDASLRLIRGGTVQPVDISRIPSYANIDPRLKEAPWQESTIISANVVETIADLKRQPGGDIIIDGSATLVHSLLGTDLIDEYRFLVEPFVMGRGRRFFPDGTPPTKLRLVESKALASGTLALVYRPDKH